MSAPALTVPDTPPAYTSPNGKVSFTANHDEIDYHMDIDFGASPDETVRALLWAESNGFHPIESSEAPPDILEHGMRVYFWHEDLLT